MRIDSTYSLSASNRLQATTKAISRSLERLSSGQRINSARDDVAGFSAIQNIDAQVRGYRQSIQSINQAQSLIQSSTSVLSSQMELVQRLRELALESLNASVSDADRKNLNIEFQQLYAEFDRLARESKFNDLHLLDGSTDTISFLLGADENSSFDLSLVESRAQNMMTQNVGTGTFAFASTLFAGTSNFTSSIKDFNQDGKMDLAVVSQDSNYVSIYLGNGNGSFAAQRTYALGGNGINYMQSADFNNDGILDIVGVRSGVIAVLLGNGDGSFAGVQTLETGAGTYQKIEVGDLDHDGNKDLVTTNTTDSTISIHYGRGNGSFEARSTIAASSNDIAVGDMDGDGFDELVSNEGATLKIRKFLGSSRTYTTTATSVISSSIVLGDFNDDGLMDFISMGGNLYTGINLGNLTFKTTSQALPAGVGEAQVVDINGDHFNDLLMGSTVGPSILTYLGDGAGSFSAGWSITSPVNNVQTNSGDFNGDGVPELFISGNGTTNVYLYSQGVTEQYLGQDSNISTRTKAERALKALDSALVNILEAQSFLGAQGGRLDYALSNSQSMTDILSESGASLQNMDFAEEIAELTRNQILQQAQVAVLGQANLQMQVVLGLLSQN